MRRRETQRGLTLPEMVIVIAAMAVFVGLAMPALRSFFSSLGNAGPAKPMISAALATARAIAAKEQRYAGVRFQPGVNPADPMNPLAASQYMVYIVQDPALGAWFFRAVDDAEPIKLPTEIGVTDLVFVPGGNRNPQNPVNPLARTGGLPPQWYVDEIARDPSMGGPAGADSLLSFKLTDVTGSDVDVVMRDVTTFSIIFSPAGKLVVTGVRVVNRDGLTDVPSNAGRKSADDIFNTAMQVHDHVAMFPQDCYWGENTQLGPVDYGLGPEPSRTSFVIFEKGKLKDAYARQHGWTECLCFLKRIHLNPYTGTMIDAD
jgi:prepilin-type N-terminal cleavage/methylation domain-containing protein